MALAVTFAASGAMAQTAASVPVGKPLPLLAGLRPPHDSKAHESKHRTSTIREVRHTLRAKTEHHALRRTAARKTHAKFSRKLAVEHKSHHDAAADAAAKTDEASTSGTAAPAANAPSPAVMSFAPPSEGADANAWPSPPAAPSANMAAAPASQTTPPADAGPKINIVNVKTVQPGPRDQATPSTPLDSSATPAALQPDGVAAAPVAQTALAAPDEESPVGSASWIAQVLAALGGAAAAGAVAWILIGSGPTRTYG